MHLRDLYFRYYSSSISNLHINPIRLGSFISLTLQMRTQRSNILYMLKLEFWFRSVLLQRLLSFTSSNNFGFYQIDKAVAVCWWPGSVQWQRRWFVEEPLKKWQTCHMWKFPFVKREFITKWPGSRVHKSFREFLSQPYLVLNIYTPKFWILRIFI